MTLLAAPAAFAVAGVAGIASLRRSVRRSRVVADRHRTILALRALRSVAEAGASVPDAADALVEVLHLRSCHYETDDASVGRDQMGGSQVEVSELLNSCGVAQQQLEIVVDGLPIVLASMVRRALPALY